MPIVRRDSIYPFPSSPNPAPSSSLYCKRSYERRDSQEGKTYDTLDAAEEMRRGIDISRSRPKPDLTASTLQYPKVTS